MKLSAAQQTVSNSSARFRCLVAGRRFGKSFLSINEIAKYAHIPNRNVGYWAPTRQMAKTILWDELKTRLIAVRWVSSINESELTIKLKNNSKIFLRSADNPDASRGLSLDAAVLDEAQDIDPRMITEIIRPALADRQGSMLVIGTPKGIGNHLYDIYKDKSFSSWQYTTAAGGRVSEEELALAREMLDERTYKQEFEASFETYANVLYWSFTGDNIVDTTPAIDPRETLYIGGDFNTSPISAVVGVRRGEQMFIVDELEIFNSNTNELVDELKARYPTNPIWFYPDASGSRKQTSSNGISDHIILQSAGFKVVTGRINPPVLDRIAAVNSRLCNSNGLRQLLINNKCRRMIETLTKQSFKENTRIPDKESGYDHLGDSLGYLIWGIWPIKRESPQTDQKVWTHF